MSRWGVRQALEGSLNTPRGAACLAQCTCLTCTNTCGITPCVKLRQQPVWMQSTPATSTWAVLLEGRPPLPLLPKAAPPPANLSHQRMATLPTRQHPTQPRHGVCRMRPGWQRARAASRSSPTRSSWLTLYGNRRTCMPCWQRWRRQCRRRARQPQTCNCARLGGRLSRKVGRGRWSRRRSQPRPGGTHEVRTKPSTRRMLQHLRPCGRCTVAGRCRGT